MIGVEEFGIEARRGCSMDEAEVSGMDTDLGYSCWISSGSLVEVNDFILNSCAWTGASKGI